MPDEEVWQGYGEDGEPHDSPVTKLAAREEGTLHGGSHLWLWTRSKTGDIQILLQERATDKPTWPGFYDISAAGHIDYGETPLTALLRESQEELGLRPGQLQPKLLFVYRQYFVDEVSGYIENEFQWVYGAEIPAGLKLDLNDEEVSAVKWVALTEFRELVAGTHATGRVVPHDDLYYQLLLQQIEQPAGKI